MQKNQNILNGGKNMRTSKKVVVFLVTVAVLAAFLIGCGGGGSTSPKYTFNAPQNLEGTATRDVAILTWDAPDAEGDGELVGYMVFKGNNRGTLISGDTPITARTFRDEDVTPGATHRYTVRAIYKEPEGESGPSNALSLEIPTEVVPVFIPPANLQVMMAPGADCNLIIRFNWSPGGAGSSGQLWGYSWRVNNGDWEYSEGRLLTYNQTMPGTEYTFDVRTVYVCDGSFCEGDCEGHYSSHISASITTPAASFTMPPTLSNILGNSAAGGGWAFDISYPIGNSNTNTGVAIGYEIEITVIRVNHLSVTRDPVIIERFSPAVQGMGHRVLIQAFLLNNRNIHRDMFGASNIRVRTIYGTHPLVQDNHTTEVKELGKSDWSAMIENRVHDFPQPDMPPPAPRN
jgi:hypothetical protein